ncbi:DgyrCDS10285 [Dimorphilus gyrociliatus]|uniref:DgyrCDS10285 n=1 Tax=Dimorphilus gyrociliatus TaxID=2664684 RepID=A0A7I8W0Y1_9ANNE|nr:DgyrCDS10285 [Dimorphilus gyrociliatus]
MCSESASELHRLIKLDSLVKAKLILKNYKKYDKQKIVNELVKDVTALFLAAVEGRVTFVHYLIEECNADLEKPGIFVVAQDKGRHKVTPLWAAAVSNHLEVVKILLKAGAHVNALSDTGSTPVRSACYMTNIDVIKTLIEYGADIHKANKNGGTCLINAVQSAELCQILVDQGVALDKADMSGNVALHYAVKEGRIDSVRLLLRYGADVHIKNENGDDVIRTAALRCQIEIVELIHDEAHTSDTEYAEALDLLGAQLMDENHDLSTAMTIWGKAIDYRIEKSLQFVKPSEPIPAYNYASGVENRQDLDNLLESPDKLYMQALLLRQEILGPRHRDTLFGLMYRGAVYADNRNFEQCVRIWLHGLKLRKECCNSFHECAFALQALTKLFWEMTDKIDQKNLREVIDIAIDQMKLSSSKENGDIIIKLLTHQLILVRECDLPEILKPISNFKRNSGLNLVHCVVNNLWSTAEQTVMFSTMAVHLYK